MHICIFLNFFVLVFPIPRFVLFNVFTSIELSICSISYSLTSEILICAASADFRPANWNKSFCKNLLHTIIHILESQDVSEQKTFACPFLYFYIRKCCRGWASKWAYKIYWQFFVFRKSSLIHTTKHIEGHQKYLSPHFWLTKQLLNLLNSKQKPNIVVQEFPGVFKGFRSWQFDFGSWKRAGRSCATLGFRKPKLISWTEITIVGLLGEYW